MNLLKYNFKKTHYLKYLFLTLYLGLEQIYMSYIIYVISSVSSK